MPTDLVAQIAERRQQISTDQYSMSIGEMLNIYGDGELDIHPEFQRWFRWTPTQKTRLIESMLLNIPIPPIFVAQREDGIWDVVDGLQRLSTIFQFVGVLTDADGKAVEPLRLAATKYLPALEGVVWEDDDDPSHALPGAQRIDFKRRKITVVIIASESDPNTKDELFQRLNTGGTQLSDQELRNCMLVMLNRDFYKVLEELAETPDFRGTVPLTDRQIDDQYHLVLVLRFLSLVDVSPDELREVVDVGEYLTDRMLALVGDGQDEEDWRPTLQAFGETFRLLHETLDENCFRRWDAAKQRWLGAFSISAYEVIAAGLGWGLLSARDVPQGDELVEAVKSVAD